MEKQKLPNANAILVLGILSILGCCLYGIPSVLLAITALVMARKATKLHLENPDLYEGINNVKTGKIIAIIGLILGLLMAAYMIGIIAYFGLETLQDPELLQEKLRELQNM